jgi:hypothetical protein
LMLWLLNGYHLCSLGIGYKQKGTTTLVEVPFVLYPIKTD